MDIKYKRHSGILMHITSLPSKYGIGDLGSDAYTFLDKLKESGFDLWQILPLGPTGFGNSPYSPKSSFAFNELLISPEDLYKRGYVRKDDIETLTHLNRDKVDFNHLIAIKMPLLKKAAKEFLRKEGKNGDFEEFKAREKYWLKDYALFSFLYDKAKDARWMLWPKEYKDRDENALKDLEEKNKEEIECYEALQFIFEREYKGLKNYANSIGVKIIGDIPIFVGRDSADTWSRPYLFKRDSSGSFNKVSGVPPDNFSPTGQLWGNPVYDWQIHEKDDFSWWKERIKRTLEAVDILRIDHFRGFDAYYEIDANANDASNGVWVKSPGEKLFKALKEELGELNIIAEDLGLLTESVEKLRDDNHFPGMKISHDGFLPKDGNINGKDDFLPHNYTRPFVAYTGTHDNNTSRGWFNGLSEDEKKYVLEYLDTCEKKFTYCLCRAVMLSNADYAILPMQDILDLDESARMNFPSTCNDKNWSWRMSDESFTDDVIKRFKRLNELSGRGI